MAGQTPSKQIASPPFDHWTSMHYNTYSSIVCRVNRVINNCMESAQVSSFAALMPDKMLNMYSTVHITFYKM